MTPHRHPCVMRSDRVRRPSLSSAARAARVTNYCELCLSANHAPLATGGVAWQTVPWSKIFLFLGVPNRSLLCVLIGPRERSRMHPCSAHKPFFLFFFFCCCCRDTLVCVRDADWWLPPIDSRCHVSSVSSALPLVLCYRWVKCSDFVHVVVLDEGLVEPATCVMRLAVPKAPAFSPLSDSLVSSTPPGGQWSYLGQRMGRRGEVPLGVCLAHECIHASLVGGVEKPCLESSEGMYRVCSSERVRLRAGMAVSL